MKTNTNKISISVLIMVLLAGVAVFATGCDDSTFSSVSRLLNPDCYVDGALTESEYEDLNAAEQLLYEKNSCDLYVETDVGEVVNDVSDWF